MRDMYRSASMLVFRIRKPAAWFSNAMAAGVFIFKIKAISVVTFPVWAACLQFEGSRMELIIWCDLTQLSDCSLRQIVNA